MYVTYLVLDILHPSTRCPFTFLPFFTPTSSYNCPSTTHFFVQYLFANKYLSSVRLSMLPTVCCHCVVAILLPAPVFCTVVWTFITLPYWTCCLIGLILNVHCCLPNTLVHVQILANQCSISLCCTLYFITLPTKHSCT